MKLEFQTNPSLTEPLDPQLGLRKGRTSLVRIVSVFSIGRMAAQDVNDQDAQKRSCQDGARKNGLAEEA